MVELVRARYCLWQRSIAGIRAFQRIDPDHETVHQFSLTDSGLYVPPVIYIHEHTLVSSIFPDLHLNLLEIFAAE